MNNPTAAILIIGNEILSGRTLDLNTQFIASKLSEIGVDLLETRTVADNQEAIINHVRHLKSSYDYLFTTGGIGPTHDDITSLSVAKAFGVELIRNEEIYQILSNYYISQNLPLNDARIKMSLVPNGAKLIYNKVTNVPSFSIDNVYVMAGIPEIMRSTFESIIPSLQKGQIIKSHTIKVMTTETTIAETLTNLQNKYINVDIGSYPFTLNGKFDHNGKYGTVLVLRSSEYDKLDQAFEELKQYIQITGIIVAD